MTRHRLLDAKRNHKVHTRIQPSNGLLYTAFYARYWLTSPDEYNSTEMIVPPLAKIIIPTQPFKWEPRVL
jgi:hypothetical protein